MTDRTDKEIAKAIVVEIAPTSIWIEKDLFGTVHIKMQHAGFDKPFTFIQMHYDYAYTSNSHQQDVAERIMALLGVTEIEYREAPLPDFASLAADTLAGEK